MPKFWEVEYHEHERISDDGSHPSPITSAGDHADADGHVGRPSRCHGSTAGDRGALARSQPQESITLARAVGADPAALARLLRTLVNIGVLAEPLPGRYALTGVGELLRSSIPGSMRDWIIAETDTPHWQAWGKLHESVRSGQTMVSQLFGVPIYEYYAVHPEDRAAFSRAMGNLSALSARGTVQHYDFSNARHIVDVGGAHGDLLLAILQANPRARGTVFDLPHVAESARRAIQLRGYHGRCEVLGGDFFQAAPPDGDIYLLNGILANWRDAEALRILHNCRAGIAPEGKLLVIAMVLPYDNHPSLAQLLDLNMLVMTGGQQRTAAEYGALLAQAGFRLHRIIPTGSPVQVLEAVLV
jgi:O-methyltransferase domain